MKLVDINFSPSKEELLSFGKTMIIGFSIFALIAYFIFGAPKVAIGFVVFGFFSFVLSFFGKAALAVYLPWMGFAFIMGTIVSNAILALIYFVLITPIGLFFKLTGRDVLNRKFKPGVSTYWSDAQDRDGHSVEDYEKQF